MTSKFSIYGNLDDIFLFCSTVEEGSLTKASKRLGIPVSTLSRRIGLLEERVGEQLLMTKGRELVPTEQGLVFFEALGPVVGSAIRQFDSFKQTHNSLSGTVNLIVPRAFFYDVIIRVLPEILRSFPGVNLNIRLAQQEENHLEPDVDLAVVYRPVDPESFSVRPLYGRHAGFYVSQAFLRSQGCSDEVIRGSQADLPQLAQLPWIAHFSNITTIPVYKDEAIVAVLDARPRLVVNDVHALTDIVRAGLGAAAIPIPRAERHRELVRIFPSFHGIPRRFFLLVRKSRYKIQIIEEVAGRIETRATEWAMKNGCLDFMTSPK